jgi:hypothetical protein
MTSPFDQLVAAARAQPEPQVLLFVFAGAELPANATPAQRARFNEGMGGELTPLMCVEKTFEALVQESRRVGPPWQVVFAAGLGGKDGVPPRADAISAALQTMVERVKHGAVDNFLALSVKGDALSFT